MSTATSIETAARAVRASKIYGTGDTAVHALDEIDAPQPMVTTEANAKTRMIAFMWSLPFPEYGNCFLAVRPKSARSPVLRLMVQGPRPRRATARSSDGSSTTFCGSHRRAAT